MKSALFSFSLLCFALPSIAQDKLAFKLFDSKGKAVKYEKMLKKVVDKDVLFFGELHNNPIAHWLQLEMTQDIFDKRDGEILLGAEMFERDNQLLLNEYFSGMITEKNFEGEARLWPNYQTDYKPLVQFAKNNELAFIATNIPRRYASLVFREGIEKLNDLEENAKDYIAPLPIEIDLELPAYKDMLGMMSSHTEGNIKFPQAQAIKDATMAHSIVEYMVDGKQFIHYNGSYHSDRYQGIIWYLNKYNSKLSVATVKTIEQEDINQLQEDMIGTADFIFVIPANMTKTY